MGIEDMAEFVEGRGGADRELEWGFGCLEL